MVSVANSGRDVEKIQYVKLIEDLKTENRGKKVAEERKVAAVGMASPPNCKGYREIQVDKNGNRTVSHHKNDPEQA